MTNEEYIQQHRNDDVRALALKKVPEGVDAHWCLQQIEGWQLARKKLPRWAATEGVWFPPRLSMEQCSSELTAAYKREVLEQWFSSHGIKAEEATFADLTGGFGIDFSYIAQLFGQSTYVERQPHLCEIARHNFTLLSPGSHVVEGDCTDVDIDRLAPTVLYLDPARRDDIGRKVAALEDCTPNVITLQDSLLEATRTVLLKLSPMLDITQALRQLKAVRQVHVVSVRGECKEVLLLMAASAEEEPNLTYHCVNLETEDEKLTCHEAERQVAPVLRTTPLTLEENKPAYLFEPNASVLKAGVQDTLCQRYGLEKLSATSNLFVGSKPIDRFPGRLFRIECIGDFSKSGLKQVLAGLKQANLTIRNFPSTVAELRKRLKVKEGGDTYLFATTLSDGKHTLIRGRKAEKPKKTNNPKI